MPVGHMPPSERSRISWQGARWKGRLDPGYVIGVLFRGRRRDDEPSRRRSWMGALENAIWPGGATERPGGAFLLCLCLLVLFFMRKVVESG